MKTVRYTAEALKDLKRHGNMAERIGKALAGVASESGAHANNVTQLVGSPLYRLRVGDFRVIFSATESEIMVVKVAPRGSAYD